MDKAACVNSHHFLEWENLEEIHHYQYWLYNRLYQFILLLYNIKWMCIYKFMYTLMRSKIVTWKFSYSLDSFSWQLSALMFVRNSILRYIALIKDNPGIRNVWNQQALKSYTVYKSGYFEWWHFIFPSSSQCYITKTYITCFVLNKWLIRLPTSGF